MTTTRQRRIRAHRERVLDQNIRRRPEAVALQVERIDRFDAALARVVAWSALAIAVLTVIAIAATAT